MFAALVASLLIVLEAIPTMSSGTLDLRACLTSKERCILGLRVKTEFFIWLIASLSLITACSTDYNVLESAPEIITHDSLRHSITVHGPVPILHPGKVAVAGSFLLINEPYKGWHIINNGSPSSPQNVAFIEMPGALEGVVRNGYFYANNSIDLVVFDIADPTHPSVIRRLENLLPSMPSPHTPVSVPLHDNVIVGWHDSVVLVTIPAQPPG